MLDEGQLCEVTSPLGLAYPTNGLSKVNVIRSVAEIESSSPQKFPQNRPPRPFSNPTKSLQLGHVFHDNNNSGQTYSTDITQISRPSSTPTHCNLRLGVPKHQASYLSKMSGTLIGETKTMGEIVNDAGYNKSLSQQGAHEDLSLVIETTVPCVSPALTTISSVSQLLTDDYTPTTNLPNVFSPFRPASNLGDKKNPPKGRNYRYHLKRPHSAVTLASNSLDVEAVALRPSSAPKRLLEDVFEPVSSLLASGTTLSFDNMSSQMEICGHENNRNPPPKSTLEALVASDSPLLFFSSAFSADADKDPVQLCNLFGASSPPQKQCTLPSLSDQPCRINISLGLEPINVDFLPNDTESDGLNANSANSVSSSKSMVSLDLSETNITNADDPIELKSNLNVSPDDLTLDNATSLTTQFNAYVEAMRSYAAELCPVDCVIMLERCRPFNCDTSFMKYFHEQYLCPILSNLNGGPPLNADFGRDAYTSLYSLHGFYWRKPLDFVTWVPDTPIIYRILKQLSTLQHEGRHANDHSSDSLQGIPGHELVEAAVRAFDAIDRVRRGLCRQVQRHLVLLVVSPIDLKELTEYEFVNASHTNHSTYASTNGSHLTSSLENLRQRGVALSAFSPIRSPSLLKLFELVNGAPASTFYDRRWLTVALSKRLLNSDSPERRIVGPAAAAFHAQAEAEINLLEEQNQSGSSTFKDTNNNNNDNGHSSPNSPHSQGVLERHTFQTQILPLNDTGSPNIAQPRVVHVVGPDCGVINNNSNNDNNSLSVYSSNRPTVSTTAAFCTISPTGNYSSSSGTATITHSVGTRFATDAHRLSEHSCNPLSVGYSGPNSVDQPGSVYGSDSVATPQAPSLSLMSPQQSYNTGSSVTTQMVSPVSSMALSMSNPNPNSHSQPSVQCAPYQQQQQQQQQHLPLQHSHLHHAIQTHVSVTGPPMSPCATGQAAFRSPSNANSPSAPQPLLGSSGLPSPSAASSSVRIRGRQYSPQMNSTGLTQTASTAPPQRHASPHSLLTTQQNAPQSMRSHALNSPDTMSANLGAGGRNASGSLNSTGYSGQPPVPTMSHSSHFTPSPYSHPNGMGSGPNQSTSMNSLALSSTAHSQQTCSPYSNYDATTVTANCRHSASSGSLTSSPVNPPYGQLMTTTVASNNTGRSSNLNISMNDLNYRELVSDSNFRRVDVSQPHMSAKSAQVQAMRRQQQQQQKQKQQQQQQQQQLPPMDSSMGTRSVLWEGEAQLTDSNTGFNAMRLTVRLILERTVSREISQLNMQQLWGPTALITVIHAHQDSPVVHRLSSPLSSGYILAHVLVEIPHSEEAFALITALSTRINPMALPLGILSPSSNAMPNMLASGSIALVCLTYNPKRSCVQGLIPADSEQFQQDVSTRQYVKPPSIALLDGSGGANSASAVIGRPYGGGPRADDKHPSMLQTNMSTGLSAVSSGSSSSPFLSSTQQQSGYPQSQSDQRNLVAESAAARDTHSLPSHMMQLGQSYTGPNSGGTAHYQPGTNASSNNSGQQPPTPVGSSSSYGPTNNANIKFPSGIVFGSEQQQQGMLQRDTSSPRTGGPTLLADPQPPPQWVGSQAMDPYIQPVTSQAQLQQTTQAVTHHPQSMRGMKTQAQPTRAKQQQQAAQPPQRVGSFGSIHSSPGQSYAFQPQLRPGQDRMASTFASGPVSNMMVQLNDPLVSDSHHPPTHRNSSPQLSMQTGQSQPQSNAGGSNNQLGSASNNTTSTMNTGSSGVVQSGGRFMPTCMDFSQTQSTMPSTGQFAFHLAPQMSSQASGYTTSAPLSSSPSVQQQSFASRGMYANTSGNMAYNNTATINPTGSSNNPMSSGCYSVRGGSIQGSYQVLPDSSTPPVNTNSGGMGFVPMSGAQSSDMKLGTMDASLFPHTTVSGRIQPVGSSLSNCSVVPMDSGAPANPFSGDVVGSAQQQQHMFHQPVYGVIRTLPQQQQQHLQQSQHPGYDLCESGTTPGYF